MFQLLESGDGVLYERSNLNQVFGLQASLFTLGRSGAHQYYDSDHHVLFPCKVVKYKFCAVPPLHFQERYVRKESG